MYEHYVRQEPRILYLFFEAACYTILPGDPRSLRTPLRYTLSCSWRSSHALFSPWNMPGISWKEHQTSAEQQQTESGFALLTIC